MSQVSRRCMNQVVARHIGITLFFVSLIFANFSVANLATNISSTNKKIFGANDPVLFLGGNSQSINAYHKETQHQPAGVRFDIDFELLMWDEAASAFNNTHDLYHIHDSYQYNYLMLNLFADYNYLKSFASQSRIEDNVKKLFLVLKKIQQPIYLRLNMFDQRALLEEGSEHSFKKFWKTLSKIKNETHSDNVNLGLNISCSSILSDNTQSVKSHITETLDRFFPEKLVSIQWVSIESGVNCPRIANKNEPLYIDTVFNYVKGMNKPIVLANPSDNITNHQENENFTRLKTPEHMAYLSSIESWNTWFKSFSTILNKYKPFISALDLTIPDEFPAAFYQHWRAQLGSSMFVDAKPFKEPRFLNAAYTADLSAISIPGKVEAENFNFAQSHTVQGGKLLSKQQNLSCRDSIYASIVNIDNSCVVDMDSITDSALVYDIEIDKSFSGYLSLSYLSRLNKKIHITLKNDKGDTVTSYPFELPKSRSKSIFSISYNKISHLPKGHYHLHVHMPDSKVRSRKQNKFYLDHIQFIATNERRAYLDYAQPVPGAIEAETFDIGPNSESYFNISQSKQTRKLKSLVGNEDRECLRFADIEVSSHEGGCGVGNFLPTEWLKYQVYVSDKGAYDLLLYAAAAEADTAVNIYIDGNKVVDHFKLPARASTSINEPIMLGHVDLELGRKDVKVEFVSATITERPRVLSAWFDKFELSKPYAVDLQQKPYLSMPQEIPGILDVSAFDQGGHGVAYFDSDVGNLSLKLGVNPCRADSDVDVLELNASCILTHNQEGEWLEYTVNIKKSGYYKINTISFSDGPGGKFYLQVNGKGVSPAIDVPDSGSWLVPKLSSVSNIHLNKGLHTLRLVFLDNGVNGNVGNIAYLEFVQ